MQRMLCYSYEPHYEKTELTKKQTDFNTENKLTPKSVQAVFMWDRK